jgi:hypothetical protein
MHKTAKQFDGGLNENKTVRIDHIIVDALTAGYKSDIYASKGSH